MPANVSNVLRCLVAVSLLGSLPGCNGSSSQSSGVSQREPGIKPEAKNLGGNQAVASKPNGPPPVGPVAPAPGSGPGGSTPSQPAYNTRPVGPYGVRQLTLGLNDLHQAGRLLVAYYSENNAWPRNDAELRDALRDMPVVYKAIQTGDYVFVPLKSPHLTPGSQTVLIYEKLPDKSGIRLVLFGDGSVKRVNLAEFAQLKLPPP